MILPKFRAYHKTLKKMFLVENLNYLTYGEQMQLTLVKNRFKGDFRPIQDYIECTVNDVELMQFTGLYDINKKEIYEGDIMRMLNENFGKYQVNNEYIYFKVPSILELINSFDIEDIENFVHAEVVGNVHKNKNLLTKKSIT